jgi:hypothetical protein
MSKNFVAGPLLHVGDETFTFDSAREAIEALRWLSTKDGVQAVFTCSWEIRLPASRLPEEIDFPGQMYGPCNALSVGTARGWQCLHGHEHVSGASYYEEEEVVAYRQAGHPVDPNGLLMDGRPVLGGSLRCLRTRRALQDQQSQLESEYLT